MNVRSIIETRGLFKTYLKYLSKVIPVTERANLHRSLLSPYSTLEDQNKVIFVHVPKVAGNAIAEGLFGVKPTGHFPASCYRRVNKAKFDEYYKFGFVRNPWDRLVSAYHYLSQGGIGSYDKEFFARHIGVSEFDEFLEKLTSPVYSNKMLKWIHFRPQTTFTHERGILLLDYLGYYEEIDVCVEHLAATLNKHSKLKPSNVSRRDDYRTYYKTSAQVDLVGSIYQPDIETYGYKFE